MCCVGKALPAGEIMVYLSGVQSSQNGAGIVFKVKVSQIKSSAREGNYLGRQRCRGRKEKNKEWEQPHKREESHAK